ncbi:MAG: DUF4389 domain-containing protein [Gammaproteobacteria bacterium]|nr:MAG: DUF4389 domain-containing protein [Gammaproteobacteria bacterium]
MAEQINTEELKENISQRSTWLRLLYIILLAVIFTITEFIIGVVVVIQFGFVLLSGKTNDDLKQFGDALSRYVFDMLRYLTFNSDELVFPFAEWDYGPSAPKKTASAPAKKKSTRKKAHRRS